MGPGSGQQPLRIRDSGHSACGGGGESFPRKLGSELDPRPSAGPGCGSPFSFLATENHRRSKRKEGFNGNTRPA